MWALLRLPRFRGATYADDHDNRFRIAKSVFQVHGVDAAGEVVKAASAKRCSTNAKSHEAIDQLDPVFLDISEV
jgi:hypothetical protein